MGNVDGDGKIQWQSKGGGSRSGSLGSGPGEGLRACHPSGGLGLGDTLQLPEEDPCGCFGGCFEHQRRVQFEGRVAEPLRTITAMLPGSMWSCTALVKGRNKEVAEMAKQVMKKLKEVDKKGLK